MMSRVKKGLVAGVAGTVAVSLLELPNIFLNWFDPTPAVIAHVIGMDGNMAVGWALHLAIGVQHVDLHAGVDHHQHLQHGGAFGLRGIALARAGDHRPVADDVLRQAVRQALQASSPRAARSGQGPIDDATTVAGPPWRGSMHTKLPCRPATRSMSCSVAS